MVDKTKLKAGRWYRCNCNINKEIECIFKHEKYIREEEKTSFSDCPMYFVKSDRITSSPRHSCNLGNSIIKNISEKEVNKLIIAMEV